MNREIWLLYRRNKDLFRKITYIYGKVGGTAEKSFSLLKNLEGTNR